MLYARINDDDDDDDDTLYTIEGNTDGWNWIDCITIALSEMKQYYITTNTTLRCITVHMPTSISKPKALSLSLFLIKTTVLWTE